MSKDHSPSVPAANFIRNIIQDDLAQGRNEGRVVTRFPPEPNGYLHIGHVKSICLNFGLARDFHGACHMRFDDTNPTKEETEYVDAILDSVRWLGFDWGSHLYYASDYFEPCYAFSQYLIGQGLAYVDSLSAEEIRAHRGSLTEGGRDSPYRARPVAENLDLFARMRAGEFPDGAHVLRLKIDMASPNINLRDPTVYRIRHHPHWRTGDTWCIYPMYDYAHAVSDALENITHSICTLEFEDHRPLYDWVVEHLFAASRPGSSRGTGGKGSTEALLAGADHWGVAHGNTPGRPHQYEFARLNLTYTMMSKRKLLALVQEGHVQGWDDPRMPTIVGLRRRGYTPEAMRLFCERIGVSKADSLIDVSVLEDCLRTDLNARARRAVAVLDPVRLVIENYPEGEEEWCSVPNHPQQPEWGTRPLSFSRTLWVERDDFMAEPVKGFFRLAPGSEVRLRYAYVVQCTGFDTDPATGAVREIRCRYFPETRSGTPGADSRKVKGNIHWLSAAHAPHVPVRLYDRLFTDPNPAAAEDYRTILNPASIHELPAAVVEPSLLEAPPGASFQFERNGYFTVDPKDSAPGKPVFNRSVGLKDTWTR